MVARVAAACGLRTLFVAYRKLPEAPFPGALVDALRGLSWALRTTPPDRLVVGGDSAGAALALASLHFLREAAGVTPAAAILLSPMVDVDSDISYASDARNVGPDLLPVGFAPPARREFLRLYAGAGGRRALVDDGALVSPRAASTRQLRALPPLLVQCGACEVLLDSQLKSRAGPHAGDPTWRHFTMSVQDALGREEASASQGRSER